MNKKIIPRKDHEVYFLRKPPDLKSKMIRRFVHDSLRALHPLFSPATIVDIQSFVFHHNRWLMATVIETETLAEFKIIHKNPVLYTNTSIAAHAKEFAASGVNTIDDEMIGYDAEKNEPVSIPLEPAGNGSIHIFQDKLRRAPVRQGVFNTKTHRHLVIAAAGFAALSLIFSAFTFSRRAHNQPLANIDAPVQEINEIIYLPHATALLATIAQHITQIEGLIKKWQYNENTDPCLILQCNAIPVLAAHALFNQFDYAAPRDIQNVQYIDGVPDFTIMLNANRIRYSVPPSMPFPIQYRTAAIAAELTGLLRAQDITIVSETLPSPSSGDNWYTVTYTAADWNLIKSFDISDYICDKFNMRVKALDVALSGDKTTFTVICSFGRGEKTTAAFVYLGDEKYAIPAAFGYQPPAPVPPPPRFANKKFEMTAQTAPLSAPLIGSISDNSGKTIYFRDTDGKIKSRSE